MVKRKRRLKTIVYHGFGAMAKGKIMANDWNGAHLVMGEGTKNDDMILRDLANVDNDPRIKKQDCF